MDMDIAAIATGIANMKTQQSVGISMMKKALEQTEQTGEQLVEMMDVAAESFRVDISL
jgi:translation initiation factor 2 alpha subunit (eIF-2alpha)